MATTTTQQMLTVTAIVSGDAYLGDPQMALMVNGQQVGTADVSASYSNGQWQTVTFNVAAPTNLQAGSRTPHIKPRPARRRSLKRAR